MIKSFFEFCVENIINVKPISVTYSSPVRQKNNKVKPLATVPPKLPPPGLTQTSNKSSSNLPVRAFNTINVTPQKALPGPNRSLVKKPEQPPIEGEIVKNALTIRPNQPPTEPPKANTQKPDQLPPSKDQNDNEPELKTGSKKPTPFKFFSKGRGLSGRALTGAPSQPVIYGHRYAPGISSSLRRIPR